MVGRFATIVAAAVLGRLGEARSDMESWEGLYRKLDTNRDGVISVKEGSKGGFSEKHLLYYDTKVVDGVLDIDEVVAFAREVPLYKKANFDGPDPKGHLQRLGSHAPPGTPPDDFAGPEEFPSPRDFWKKYMEGHKAAVFRGAVARGSSIWTEEFVKEKYGWVDVKIEPKNESRLEIGAYKDIDGEGKADSFKHHRTTVAGVIDNPEKNVYAITILPHAMAWDFDLPRSFMCGSRNKQLDVKSKAKKKKYYKHPYPHPTGRDYMTSFLEANLWIAKGFTRSQLHYDKENILLCCIDCVKEFILIDTRKYGDKVPWARGGKYNSENDLQNGWTDWVTVDPERVDMRLYTFLNEIEYMKVTIGPGDCAFIPYSMMHQVTTHREGNLADPYKFQSAISVMIDPTEVFDEEACQRYENTGLAKHDIPFGAFDLLWYYDGTGVIPQGYPLPHQERDRVADLLQTKYKTGLTKKVHRKAVRDINPGAAMLRDVKEVDAFTDRFNHYAKNKTAGLQPSEMNFNNTPLELWLEYSARIDEMLPCDDGQYYSPRTPEVWKEMEEVLVNIEKGLPAFKGANSKHLEL